MGPRACKIRWTTGRAQIGPYAIRHTYRAVQLLIKSDREGRTDFTALLPCCTPRERSAAGQ
jgi:hypothetical protein